MFKQAHKLAACCIALACGIGLAGTANAAGSYLAQVRTTSYGVHHVTAGDYGSLGFGYGYIYASDNLCILAREVVAANGEMSRYFGDEGSNVVNDFFYTYANSDELIEGWFEDLDPDGQEIVMGYAAGYNRYLRETGVDGLAADCRGAEWVRPITQYDLLKVFYKLILRASSGNSLLTPFIVDAAPPASARSAADVARARARLEKAARTLDSSDFPSFRNTTDLGSNMYALGANTTQSGRGMVLGNPHFDWEGPLRWYQIHLKIPGEIDVMGASLQGVPLVNIGFTENFAWSHTVSFADRFTIFELELVPGQPTRYLIDGEEREMTSRTVQINVLSRGQLIPREHTFYESVYGAILDFTSLGLNFWSTGLNAFTLADANADNLRAIEQFLKMNQADSLDEFVDVLKDNIGLPWVHTVAANPDGDAFYGDISVVPNVSDAKLVACPPLNFGQLLIDLGGFLVLGGNESACAWDVDADAPQPGIIGASNLPSISTRDYVTNSNDNHWLTNPDQPLEGFAPTLGAERTQRSLRTRLGLVLVDERLAGTDGLGDPGFTLDTLQEVLYGARNYAAEMLLDDLVVLCVEEGPTVDLGGESVDVSAACNVLANWSTRQGIADTGPQIFLEFLLSAADRLGDSLAGLFAVPFDPEDPVNTPRDLADDDPAMRADIMQWIAEAVVRLEDNGMALDAPWGDLQYSERNGVRIPIHGGRDGSGMFSIITAELADGVGYSPIVHGNSYIQTVTWDDDGPVAEAILTYSQSSDPDSPHYADQTELYSNGGWVRLPFSEAEIRADPNLETIRIRERRRELTDPRD